MIMLTRVSERNFNRSRLLVLNDLAGPEMPIKTFFFSIFIQDFDSRRGDLYILLTRTSLAHSLCSLVIRRKYIINDTLNKRKIYASIGKYKS